MIRYALRCLDGHEFEGWFRSSEVFEQLRDGGQVTCPRCGGVKVEKALMAPAVGSDGPDVPTAEGPSKSPDQIEQALAELRTHVEANSDYVGMRFVQEARAMHEGRASPRAIHGEARVEDARRMITEGLPVLPLPFRPKKQMN